MLPDQRAIQRRRNEVSPQLRIGTHFLEILVFDIKVYADVYFPEDDEKACNNYVLKWREQEKDRIEEEREMEYGSHSSSADFFDESS